MGARMEKELKRYNGSQTVADVLGVCALAAALLCAALLCYTALTATSRIDPLRYEAQHIQSVQDNLLFNIVLTLGACAVIRIAFLLPMGRRMARGATCAMLLLTAVIGIIWVMQAKAVPMSDAGILYQSAVNIIRGDTAALIDPTAYEHFYFVRFPFQFGFLSYMECMVRLFGEAGALIAVQIANVLMLVSAYLAIVLTTQRLFTDYKVTLLTALLLTACCQPLLACTWMYGVIPAFCGAAWGILFAVKYMQCGKRSSLCMVAALCAVAVYMKPNAWIPVAAIGIALVLRAVRARRWQYALAAVLIVAVCIPLPKVAQARYEARIGTSFGKGYPMSSWMAMGMQESSMASGWYNGYSGEMYQTYGDDTQACHARAMADIADRAAVFAAEPAYARYFYEDKLSSQWNEPTFMSVWVSMVCKPYGARGAVAEAMYDFDGLGGRFAWLMNLYLQLLYVGFLFAIVRLLHRRTQEQLIYPLVIVGGILFHILFEANAKYALSYIALFCPLAAYGILTLFRRRA